MGEIIAIFFMTTHFCKNVDVMPFIICHLHLYCSLDIKIGNMLQKKRFFSMILSQHQGQILEIDISKEDSISNIHPTCS